MNIQNSWQRGMRMERHISSPREVRKGCEEGEREGEHICGGELVKWLWLVMVRCWEEKGKTETRSVFSGERTEGQLKEHSGARSCDKVTRNKSAMKMESDSLAPLLKHSADSSRTLLHQICKEYSLYTWLHLLEGQSRVTVYIEETMMWVWKKRKKRIIMYLVSIFQTWTFCWKRRQSKVISPYGHGAESQNFWD